MRYLNIKSQYGIETVDELNIIDFNSYKDFKIELNRLVNEYRLAGMNVYISNRSTKLWKE